MASVIFISPQIMPPDLHLFKQVNKFLQISSAEGFKFFTSISSKPMDFLFLFIWILYKPLHQCQTKSTLTGSVAYCLTQCNNHKLEKLLAHKHSINIPWNHLLLSLHIFWYQETNLFIFIIKKKTPLGLLWSNLFCTCRCLANLFSILISFLLFR